jgi:hypothetical protein
MENRFESLAALTDQQLIAKVRSLVGKECEATAALIASLGELDERRLYLAEGFPSLFAYCIHVLHLTEHAAYNRIEVARIARHWPVILQMIADGSVTLTAVRMLSASLTDANHRELLAAATHKTKSEMEKLVAALRPQPPVPCTIRKLPAPKPEPAQTSALECVDAPISQQTLQPPDIREAAASPVPPHRPAVIVPIAPERYKVQMTVTRETHDKLRRAQELLRHSIPTGDPAAIFERALSLLVADLERKRCAATKTPRPAAGSTPGSRHVPAAVKREVWARDKRRCAFVGALGRCPERGFLELHHVVPFADGGATDTANLQLRCRAHNAFEAEAWFGREEMQTRPDVVPTRSGPS